MCVPGEQFGTHLGGRKWIAKVMGERGDEAFTELAFFFEAGLLQICFQVKSGDDAPIA